MTMWLLIGLGIVIGLCLLPWLVGMFLPKSFMASTQVNLPHPPEAVWAAIVDFKNYPVSAKMHKATEALESASELPTWRENLGSSWVRITTLESDKPVGLVRRFADETVPMTLICRYRILPTGEGSTVELSADGVIESGTWHVPFFRFMIHVFGGVKSGQKQYLKLLASGLSKAG